MSCPSQSSRFKIPNNVQRRIFSVALQLRRAKTDRSGFCQMTVQGALWLAKRLSLNHNFSFLNRILLRLISSSYPVVLTRLGGPRSRPYTSRKISRVLPGIEPGTSWMAVKRANHYTKQVVQRRIQCIYISALYNFLHSLVILSFLAPNIFLSTLFSKTLNLCSSLKVRDQVSQPYNTTGSIPVIVLCLNFQFLGKQTSR